MAAPTNVTAIWKTVVVTLDKPTGVTSTNPNILTGTVSLIGGNVLRVIVGDQVLFKKDTLNATFNQSGTTSWAAIQEDEILLVYTTPP